ncbi:hypothetical protein G6F56_000694 [Rhizopus delemar]|nr:hypothetical protein G6F56_000694 [Rhizopus delemar]
MNYRLFHTRRLFHSTLHSRSLQFYQNKVIEDYANQAVNPATLRQFIFFGRQMNLNRLVTSANWVRNELLIRLAHRIRGFQQLPFIVGSHPDVDEAYQDYCDTFQTFRQFPPCRTQEDNAQFCQLLRDLLQRGLRVPQRGLCESAALYPPDQHDLDLFLNRMLRSRISRQILAKQHLALTEACEHHTSLNYEGNVGIIFVNCSALEIVKSAQTLVYQGLKGEKPEIKVMLHQSQEGEIVFAYVPEQLESILYELLDNAVRYSIRQKKKMVEVTVSANATDVYFRISDRAGGMTQDRYERLWSYQARARLGEFDYERISHESNNLGIGLMMSRIYAEYWGGELQVITMDGHGTDVYVRIPRLGTNTENLGITHPAFHDTTAKPGEEKIRLHSDPAPKTQTTQLEWVDTSLTHKAFAGNSWSESLMIQS